MKVGDKLYCIKDRDDGLGNIMNKKGTYYIILSIMDLEDK
jgi:hypothetical protein